MGATGWTVSACTEGRLCATEVCLRFLACGLALVAAVVLAVDTETHDFMGLSVKVARYTDIPAFVLLVIVNGVAASSNLLQSGRCLVISAVRSGNTTLVSKPMACAVFICDQVIAYMVVSAPAAALVPSMIGKHGLPVFGWMGTADLYAKFSMQAAGAIVCALLAAMLLVAMSAMSAFNLFRLYGTGKGTNMS